jgi:hypothetical protein
LGLGWGPSETDDLSLPEVRHYARLAEIRLKARLL